MTMIDVTTGSDTPQPEARQSPPGLEPDVARIPDGFAGPAVVEQTNHLEWRLVRELRYGANSQEFTVPVGATTDFASVPRLTAWLMPRSGPSARAGILHDHLWRVEAPAGRIAYREADGILRQALRRCGVPFVLRWLCWTGVRWGALLTRKNGYVGWWRDAPLVLLWTVLALPVVLPPTVVIGLALVVIAVVEALCWVPLRLGSRRKQVNPPKITIHT